jgi:diguanylate cyclase (GGDEF)-like protein
MNTQHSGTVTLEAVVTINGKTAAESPVVVHKDTPLGELDGDFSRGRYVFAANDTGRIIGIVSCREIQMRLRLTNDRERARWWKMPLASLLRVTFPEDGPLAAPPLDTTLDCTLLVEDGELTGIVTDGEIFLGWQRLAGVVSGAASDPLTGLMSRLGYERRLMEEWNRAARTGCSIGVVLVDLDNFKTVNDCYGHVEGDRLLCEVATSLETSLRSYDILARYGGDEFVALCLGCRPGQIKIPIRRMLTRLQEADFEGATDRAAVSISVGAAVRHEGFSESHPTALFELADRCLYRAKQSRGGAVFVDEGTGWRKEQRFTVQAPPVIEGLPAAAQFEELVI